MDGLSAEQKKKAESLTALGLPEEQAVKSVTAKPSPTGLATHCYAMLKIKADADMGALTDALKAYSAASKASKGKVSASYSIASGEVQFFEIYDSMGAMDEHIGNCFPHYVKMLPHADMAEIVCVVDPKDLDAWKASLAAWGASKFIVTAAI